MKKSINKDTISNIIYNSRYPLALLVVMIHCKLPTNIDFGSFIIREYILYFCSVAVPLFFLFSGYLYFLGVESFDKETYRIKTKKRIKTLVIPYLFWNTLYLLFHVSRYYFSHDSFLSSGCKSIESYSLFDWISCYFYQNVITSISSYYPLNVPLWFLRDLIIYVLFSPLIYYLVKKVSIVYIIVLLLSWVIFGTGDIGFILIGISFFSVGAYFAIHKRYDLYFRNAWLYVLLLVFVILSPIFVDDGSMRRLGTLLGCILFILLIGSVPNKNIRLCYLGNYSMFIYLSQAIVLAFVQKMLLFDNNIMQMLSLWILSVTICMLFYKILEKTNCKLLWVWGIKTIR